MARGVSSPGEILTRSLGDWLLVITLGILAALVVNPSGFSFQKVGWLLDGDMVQTLVGWEFYRESPLSQPLTRIEKMLPGRGFSTIQSDTMPWFSLMGKLGLQFFDVKAKIHFIGFWLILCWILQAVYANLLAHRLQLSKTGRYFLVMVTIFSPVLLARFGHFSLMAHWLVLASLYEALKTIQGERLSLLRLGHIATLSVFSLGTHPYLFAIVIPIFALAVILSPGKFSTKLNLFAFVGFASLFSVKVLGFSKVKEMAASDFGACNTDLLGIFNSFGASLFVPKLRAFWCQPEGFCYFGLVGLLGLVVFRRGLKNLLQQWWRGQTSKVFFLLALGYVIYSLASPVRFGGNPVVHLWFYQYLAPLPSIFRSSGRWIWPIYYLLTIALVFLFDRWSGRHKTVVVIFLIVFHLVEFIPTYRWDFVTYDSDEARLTELMERVIPEAPANSMSVMQLFPNVMSVGCGLDDKRWSSRDWGTLMIALARKGWLVDSGMGARFESGLVRQCLEKNKGLPPKERPLITKVLPRNAAGAHEFWPGVFFIGEN